MQIIPVIDIKGGVVVHAVAGQRDRYQPIESNLFEGSDPWDFVREFRELGYESIYLADLDGIVRNTPDLSFLRRLRGEPIKLLLDIGIRSSRHVREIVDELQGWPAGWTLIIASESLERMEDLTKITQEGIALCFSLDLFDGKIRGCGGSNVDEIVSAVSEAGIQQVIVLDTVAVGAARGVVTLELCKQVKQLQPKLSVVTGGGVRGAADLQLLETAGVNAAMVATALHKRAIP